MINDATNTYATSWRKKHDGIKSAIASTLRCTFPQAQLGTLALARFVEQDNSSHQPRRRIHPDTNLRQAMITAHFTFSSFVPRQEYCIA